MKVLYLSQTESLQEIELDDLLAQFVKDGAPSSLLKDIVKELNAQGFSIDHQGVVGHFAVINLKLPKMNILILSDEELHALYSYAIIEEPNDPVFPFSAPAASAWLKVGELMGELDKPRKEEKEDA